MRVHNRTSARTSDRHIDRAAVECFCIGLQCATAAQLLLGCPHARLLTCCTGGTLDVHPGWTMLNAALYGLWYRMIITEAGPACTRAAAGSNVDGTRVRGQAYAVPDQCNVTKYCIAVCSAWGQTVQTDHPIDQCFHLRVHACVHLSPLSA